MTSKDSKRDDAYVVIPQKEYAHLYNRQYAELTTSKKSVDPQDKHSSYLEATLKKHYPQVYKAMIKNDYIMTSSERIQDTLNGTTNSNEKQHKAIQLSKQLDEVVVGKHKVNKLSNPIRPLAQRYVDSITKNSSLSAAKKAVLRSYLDTYVSKIPWYMKADKKEQGEKESQTKTTGSSSS